MSQNLDLRCVLISDPGTLGAWAKTRLESRIKKFTPHLCIFRYTVQEILKLTQELNALQSNYRVFCDQLFQSEGDVVRRLAWGKNANRTFESTYNTLTEGVKLRQLAVAADTKAFGAVVGVCNAIVTWKWTAPSSP